MATKLYEQEGHLCLAFNDLVRGEGVQSNQFLIIHGEHEALIDPGGDLTYTPLSLAVGKHIKIKDLDYVLASHQDPDIIASLDHWVTHTSCKVVCSRLWARFLPHLVPGYMAQKAEGRVLPIPDEGADIPFGDSVIKALPAHFLHSVGNLHFYDPISKILFSGDMGASIVNDQADKPVTDFESHIPSMIGFHRRYMCSSKVCRLWANMVREMDVRMIVPQHGRPFVGEEIIGQFLDWISSLQCGIDLLTQESFRTR